MSRAIAVAIVASTGCSLIYDGEFQDADELRDLEVADLEVVEGQIGVPLLVNGKGIAGDAEMTFELAEPSLVADDDLGDLLAGPVTLVAADGSAIARGIDLPVMTGLAAGDTTELIVTVSQQGPGSLVSRELLVTISGLDELVLSAPNAFTTWTIEDGVVT